MTTESMPLVSIGIPTYNRADGYLKEALESALAQTYSNLEIIVSDNCSTDNTEEVVKSYNDARVTYIKQSSPLIPNDNFNYCLKQARGAYFLLLHDDDKVDSDFVEACMRATDYKTSIGVIHTAVRSINAIGMVLDEGYNNVNGLSTGELFLGWIEGKTSLYLCSTLYNTQGLKDQGGMHSRHNLFQDVMATFQLAASMGRIAISETKASTREHGSKWTHVVRVSEWAEDSKDLLNLMCELAPDYKDKLNEKGGRFFANINYNRASEIRSSFRRIAAYYLVYKLFDRRYLPLSKTVIASTALYRILRQIKRRILGLPAWVD